MVIIMIILGFTIFVRQKEYGIFMLRIIVTYAQKRSKTSPLGSGSHRFKPHLGSFLAGLTSLGLSFFSGNEAKKSIHPGGWYGDQIVCVYIDIR